MLKFLPKEFLLKSYQKIDFLLRLKTINKFPKMAALVQALDNFTPIRAGENGHYELAWSNDLQERVVQFDFQCVRTHASGAAALSQTLDGILAVLSLKSKYPEKELSRKNLLVVLFKIIGKTRDINGGKGEYTLSYMMILTWYKYFPTLARIALQLFVVDPKEVFTTLDSQEPYGSWKDMKYFCKYVLDNGETMAHPLIQSCIEYINGTLRIDESAYDSAADKRCLTLVSKWVPREGSNKFGFLYDALATNYFPQYMASANYVPIAHRELTKKKALDKCRTHYRILCSKLNRHLDTVQIKQTAKCWATIDHAKTTSITMAKQRKAFLNKKSGSNNQRSKDPDRIQCAENLRIHLESLKKQGKEVKGKHVALHDFTKQAQALMTWDVAILGYTIPKSEEADILNSQWRDNSNKKNACGLGPMIAMADLSGSMSGDPLAAAVALSCRVAEKSILGRRVMTFSTEPTWINLDGKTDFTDMATEILGNSRTAGLNTDFYKALDLILSAIEQRRVEPNDVENMILAIFSDMQIDDCLCIQYGSHSYSYVHTDDQALAARRKWSTMHDLIKQKYADVGMRMYGQPLRAPHILFWNLRSTNGFPTFSSEAGCSMMSGFDPTILNMFCELGLDALRDMTPYKNLLKQLDSPRYLPLEMAANNYL
jgi:hypothetical protein